MNPHTQTTQAKPISPAVAFNQPIRITKAMLPTGAIMIAPSGKVLTEASTLGLKPGEWPTEFETDLGNRQPFVIFEMSSTEEEIVSATYRQRFGSLTLYIAND